MKQKKLGPGQEIDHHPPTQRSNALLTTSVADLLGNTSKLDVNIHNVVKLNLIDGIAAKVVYYVSNKLHRDSSAFYSVTGGADKAFEETTPFCMSLSYRFCALECSIQSYRINCKMYCAYRRVTQHTATSLA